MQSETSHNEHHSLISERLSERFLWSHVLYFKTHLFSEH